MSDGFVNDVQRHRALVVAEELLLSRYRVTQVVQFLKSEESGLALSAQAARNAVETVQATWESERNWAQVSRRELHLRSLDNLYRRAFNSKQYKLCLEIETLIAKVEGHISAGRPEPEVVVQSGAADDDEFGDRSQSELEFFAAHGYWPEEVPAEGTH